MARGGWFITFEGGEGTGKSTQVGLLDAFLRDRGKDVVRTREPGGTQLAEAIRAVVVDPRFEPDGLTELMLMEAARRDHVERVIRPALERGAVVLSDRFADSSTVYQGMVRGVGVDTAERLNTLATGGLEPDLTVVLDMAPEAALGRALERNRAAASSSRFDNEARAFHQRVRDGFRQLAAAHPQRIQVVAADGSPEAVHQRVVGVLPAQLR